VTIEGPQSPAGPVESGRLVLPLDRPLVPALVASFRQALDYAVEMAAQAPQTAQVAVHEYRKATRRARSVLRMLRPALPDQTRKALGRELRTLAEATSLLRDADVLVTTCDLLDLDGVAREALAFVRQQVAAHREALLEAGHAASVLAAGAARLPALPERLEAAVRDDTPADALMAAFEQTVERARAARERALEERTDAATHDWRKRVKELRYQVELLAEPEGGPVEGLRLVCGALAKRLGEITDVIALRSYVVHHTDGLTEAQLRALDAALEAHVEGERQRAADPLVEVRARLAALVASVDG
jgi:CHAD domain-containing protein